MKNGIRNIFKAGPRELRWPFLIPGILLGGLGARLLSGDPNWLFGVPVQALSLWLIWKAFPPESGTLLPPAGKITPAREKDKRLQWLLLSAIAVWIITFVFFEKHWWVAGACGVILLSWAWVYPLNRLKNLPPPREIFSEKAALALLMVLAVLFRFPFLGQNFTGFQNDEASNLLDTMNVLQGDIKSPFSFNYYWSYLPFFFMAPFVKIFGMTIEAGRASSAVYSLIAVYFFYKWCRLHFGLAASWLAAAFFSYCWWNLFFSLSSFQHVLFMVIFEIPALFFLDKALRDGRRIHFGLSGLFMAASFMPYNAGRLLPVLVFSGLAAIFLVEGNKFIRIYWKHFLFLFLCFFWLIGPFLANQILKPTDAFERVLQYNIFRVIVDQHAYALPFERILSSFYTYFWPNPVILQDVGFPNVPCLDPFMGFFGFLGVILALLSFRKRWSLLALSGLAFGIISNALSATGVNPLAFNGHRSFLVFPFLCFFICKGLDGAIRFMAPKPGPVRVAGAALLAAALLGSAAMNINVYFFKFKDSPEHFSAMGFNHLAMVDVIRSRYPADHIVAVGRYNSSIFLCSCYDPVEMFLTYKKIPVNQTGPLEIPIRSEVSKDVALLLSSAENFDAENEKIRNCYPHAIFKDYRNRFGEKYLSTIEIPKEDIQKLQKDLKLGPPLL